MPSRSKKLIDGKNAKKPKEKAANPFEVRVNRKKHEVLGQRGKSDVGQPGISRSKAIQKVIACLLSGGTHLTWRVFPVNLAKEDFAGRVQA